MTDPLSGSGVETRRGKASVGVGVLVGVGVKVAVDVVVFVGVRVGIVVFVGVDVGVGPNSFSDPQETRSRERMRNHVWRIKQLYNFLNAWDKSFSIRSLLFSDHYNHWIATLNVKMGRNPTSWCREAALVAGLDQPESPSQPRKR